MQKTTGSPDMPAFRKNDSNGNVVIFDVSRDINKSLNQKLTKPKSILNI